jgi:sterol O-acyltransferase
MVWASRAFVIPPLMGVILSIEQLRFCFKTYAFIRENAYKVLYPWHKDDTDGPASWYEGQMSPSVGSFSQYCYFLFCPTLLYRDHYPRNSGPIRWNRVLLYVFVFYLPSEVAAYMWVKNTTPSTINSSEMIKTFTFSMFVGLLSYFLGLISLMHGWMNLGAELTGFADRHFYADYWNCTNYFHFYRKWNVIPHHFIHQYVLKDLRKVYTVTVS